METSHSCAFEACEEKTTFRIKYTDMYNLQGTGSTKYAWSCDVHMGGLIWNLLNGPTAPAAEVKVSRHLLETQ